MKSLSQIRSKTFACWLRILIAPLIAFHGVNAVNAEDEEDMLFGVVGKKVVYTQTGPSTRQLRESHSQGGQVGAYVLFSSVVGISAEVVPVLTWDGSAAFFDAHPDIGFAFRVGDDEEEWELIFATNDLRLSVAFCR